MTPRLELIMPMAGRGSRFHEIGQQLPKPMISLHGHPFFVWATKAISDPVQECSITYVVLEEHVEKFKLKAVIESYFPNARIVVITEVTKGALETACIALPYVRPDTPIFINDCDHYFGFNHVQQAIDSMSTGEIDGALCHFTSSSPNFSYARYDDSGVLVETVEKRAVSSHAIAGAYGFRSADYLEKGAKTYRVNCPYDELFVSGVYNDLIQQGGRFSGYELDFHIPFGVPEELRKAEQTLEHFEY